MFVVSPVLAAAVFVTTLAGGQAASPSRTTTDAAALPPILSNDNRREAGLLANETLVLNLRAGLGAWRPEGEQGPALRIEAFGEERDALRIPAPLIRVPEGTRIGASVHNELDVTLRVHGLCERGGNACPPLEVPASETRDVRFPSGRAGTYHYWATTTGMPQAFRGSTDTQLSGAFIVDPPGGPAAPDRVFVITEWTSLTREQLQAVARADDPGKVFFGFNPKITF